MRPALEYASSIWSPLASWTSINKRQVMQNAALRTATGCTQDTNLQHLHDKHSYFPYTSSYSSTHHHTNKNTTSITPLTQTYNILQHSKAKKHYPQQQLLHNKHSHRPPHNHNNRHKTNMHHIHTSIVSRHLATITPFYMFLCT